MSRRSYGSPRVHRLGLGTCCSRKRVERLMRQAGVAGIHCPRRGGCTRRDGSEPCDDLVGRQFYPTGLSAVSDGCVTAERPATPDLRRPTRGSADHSDRLRYLAETGGIAAAPGDTTSSIETHVLDVRTAALARLAALVALRAAPASYRTCVDVALASGASVDDVVGTLKAVARTVGLARVVSAAPGLALAAGYDVDAALEEVDDPRGLVRVGGGRSRGRGATQGPEYG
jgi:4-carboxymuconolactone decarboxylase